MSSAGPGRAAAHVRNRPPLAGLVLADPGLHGHAPSALLSRLLSDEHAFQVGECMHGLSAARPPPLWRSSGNTWRTGAKGGN
jgi:hypothetical protein